MVPLLNVPWQKVQVPVDVCLGMTCPFLVPGATALTHAFKNASRSTRRPFPAHQVEAHPSLLPEPVTAFL
jgi:hypothetical protein